MPSGTIKASPKEDAFGSDPAQVLWAIYPKCMVSSVVGTYLLSLEKTIIAYNVLQISWITNNSKVVFSCLLLRFLLVCGSYGSSAHPVRKIPLKNMCLYAQLLTYVVSAVR